MVIAIVGPTGVGKTKLSIELAKSLNGEIINADSTQIYMGMDIATAKISENEKEGIPHHLIDFKKLEEDYSVYAYQKDCRDKIEEILKKKKIPILVGGTGLYIKAALYDYQFEKNSLKENYEQISTENLYQELSKIDSNITIHPNNRRRIIRALNFYKQTGIVPSSKEKTEKMIYPCCFIGLTMDRTLLYQRIDERVEEMMEHGLMKEAQSLFDLKVHSKAILTPIGYKELFGYFEGKQSLEDAICLMKRNSRRYAKRQYTWFRNQLPVNWFEVDIHNFQNTVSEVLTFLSKNI